MADPVPSPVTGIASEVPGAVVTVENVANTASRSVGIAVENAAKAVVESVKTDAVTLVSKDASIGARLEAGLNLAADASSFVVGPEDAAGERAAVFAIKEAAEHAPQIAEATAAGLHAAVEAAPVMEAGAEKLAVSASHALDISAVKAIAAVQFGENIGLTIIDQSACVISGGTWTPTDAQPCYIASQPNNDGTTYNSNDQVMQTIIVLVTVALTAGALRLKVEEHKAQLVGTSSLQNSGYIEVAPQSGTDSRRGRNYEGYHWNEIHPMLVQPTTGAPHLKPMYCGAIPKSQLRQALNHLLLILFIVALTSTCLGCNLTSAKPEFNGPATNTPLSAAMRARIEVILKKHIAKHYKTISVYIIYDDLDKLPKLQKFLSNLGFIYRAGSHWRFSNKAIRVGNLRSDGVEFRIAHGTYDHLGKVEEGLSGTPSGPNHLNVSYYIRSLPSNSLGRVFAASHLFMCRDGYPTTLWGTGGSAAPDTVELSEDDLSMLFEDDVPLNCPETRDP